MAKDLARLGERSRAPVWAILVMGAWTALLASLGTLHLNRRQPALSRAYLDEQMRLTREMGINLLRCHIKVPDPAYLDALARSVREHWQREAAEIDAWLASAPG